MNWKELGEGISKKVPLIGNILKNATFEVGESIGNIISSALGIENDVNLIYKYLQDNPNAILKLQELEMKHREKIYDLAFVSEELRLRDVQNARKRELGMAKLTGSKDVHLYIFSYIVSIGFFGIMVYLMTKPLPEGSSEAVLMLFGGLIGAFTSIISYFFGSSKSSAEKTNLLAKK